MENRVQPMLHQIIDMNEVKGRILGTEATRSTLLRREKVRGIGLGLGPGLDQGRIEQSQILKPQKLMNSGELFLRERNIRRKIMIQVEVGDPLDHSEESGDLRPDGPTIEAPQGVPIMSIRNVLGHMICLIKLSAKQGIHY